MDTKEREILERNESLLLSNIIQSEDFYHHLKKESVIPETMIRDIQSCETLEGKNGRLLHTLKLRGGDSYRRFRHVLCLSGHLFLADQLYGEDYDSKVLRAEEIFGKFPNLFKLVSDDVKSKFLRFLETKLKETALRSAWLKSGSDRKDFLDVKKANFENEKEYRVKLESKKRKISLLQDEIVHLRDVIKKGESDKILVQKEISDMRMSFKEDLAKQTRFNAANNNSVIQLRNGFDQFNERVKSLNVFLRGFFTGRNVSDIDDDPDNMKMSVLEKNIKRLVEIAKSNIDKTSSSSNEKEVVLSMLKTSSRHQQETLSEVVRHYVDKQEKGKASLSRELEGLLDMVRGTKFTAKFSARPRTDMKLIKSQVATLKEEIVHMQKKIEWKDVQITDLLQESTALREQFASTTPSFVSMPSAQGTASYRESPDSIQEIENVYHQFDKYMNESYTPVPPVPRMQRRGSLAEVNLEREVSPLASGRDSKIDNIDLVDILGSSSRASMSEPRSGRKGSLPNIYETNSPVASSSMSSNYSQPSVINESRICLPYMPPENKIQLPMLTESRLDSTNEDKARKLRNGSTEMGDVNHARNGENGSRKRRKKRDVEIPDFKLQNRRPSLAELITIYEECQRDSDIESEEDTNHD